MVRIYEALQQAARERGPDRRIMDFPHTRDEFQNKKIRDKMTDLYRLICAQCPKKTGRIIQFHGTHRGVGASTLLRMLAEVVSGPLDKTVLIMDADTESSQFAHYSIDPIISCADIVSARKPVEDTFYMVDHDSLFLCQAFGNANSSNFVFDSSYGREQFESLRNKFDLILVDAAPARESLDGMAMSKIVDGAIIVLAAEKTRWQVARQLKDNIEKQGGQVFGVVLNQRKYHIPESIYKRL